MNVFESTTDILFCVFSYAEQFISTRMLNRSSSSTRSLRQIPRSFICVQLPLLVNNSLSDSLCLFMLIILLVGLGQVQLDRGFQDFLNGDPPRNLATQHKVMFQFTLFYSCNFKQFPNVVIIVVLTSMELIFKYSC